MWISTLQMTFDILLGFLNHTSQLQTLTLSLTQRIVYYREAAAESVCGLWGPDPRPIYPESGA